eukprot:5476582-Ditylum_brightwellii.AAC.1
MSNDGNEPGNGVEHPKQQEGVPLPFLDHDFKVCYRTEWLQWELNVQMLAKEVTQLNAANNVGTKSKLPLSSCLQRMVKTISLYLQKQNGV